MPRLIRLALVVLAGWMLACELHALGVAWLPVGPTKWLHLIAMAAGAGLCLARAAVRREERWAWLLLGLGVAAWTAGELYFTAILWSDSSPPVPSPADAGYLSLPPLVFAGLVVLARSRIGGLPKTVWVDGVTAGLTAGALSAAVVFRPVLHALGGRSIAIATNLSYPTMDLFLLALICGMLAVGGWRFDRRFGTLALGIGCFWAADTVYLVKAAQGMWQSGGPYDPGWWSIAVCFAAAAWTRPTRKAVKARRRANIGVPIAFALASLAILVAGTFTNVTLPAILLASTALLSVLLRLVLTFRAHQAMLQHSQAEAMTDPLTGLGNRRALYAALEHLMDDVDPAPVTLVVFDLDGFKGYNDQFGHAAGDVLLKRLAGTLAEVMAPPGSAYRMGGDEFCALLPEGESANDWIGAALAALSDRGEGFSISASMGSVRLPEETDSIEDALRLADQRMYAGKHDLRRTGAAHEVTTALLSALSQRDPELSDHVDDVAELAELTARDLGCSEPLIERIRLAAALHDIGKIAIPDAILHKPAALSASEWELIRQHTIAGERIIASSDALADVGPLVRASHERWDGAGYPDGLAGKEIPLGARIIAVCDAYVAMTAERPHRPARDHRNALHELTTNAGTQFDPTVVSVLCAVLNGGNGTGVEDSLVTVGA
jgi:diguanylate cyclase (GGDEF)-like protein